MNEQNNILNRDDGINLLLLSGVGLLLVGIQFGISERVRDSLVFYHADLNPLTMWTSAYVHLTDQHLYNNLGSYVTVIAPLFILYALWDRSRDLRRAVLIMLALFPLLILTSNYLIFHHIYHATETAASRGFSGIVGALGGFLFASLVAFVWDHYGRKKGLFTGQFMFLIVMGSLLIAISDFVTWWEIGLLAVGLRLAGSVLVPRRLLQRPGDLWASVRANGLELALWCTG